MKIPASITVNTGEDIEVEVRKTIDDFFRETKSEIKKQINMQEGPSPFRIEIKNLYSIAPEPVQSDNYVHMLFYKQRVVATVLETRTDMNFVHFDYFLNIPKLL